MIPLSVPSFKGNEWNYVKECLDTEWVSSAGKYVDKFESDFASYVGSSHAVACVNGTAALQVALKLVGVQPEDEVIVPTLTFIAPINVVRYLGANPVFMDCDDYYNIDIEKVADFLAKETEFRNGFSYNKTTGKRISAIIPVHIFGNAARIQDLVEICQYRNIKIVEDATESLGTRYSGPGQEDRHTGTIGNVGCFSFNGNKIITTGGGGMIVTDNPEDARQAKYLTTQAKDDEVRYIHNEVGYNFRLTNIQAAIGVAQLERLPEILDIKRNNYLRYRQEVNQIAGLKIAECPPYGLNNHWMYALQVDKSVYGKDREGLMNYLKTQGIQTRPVWHLNHLQKPYLDCMTYKIEKAPQLLENTLNIPCSANLGNADIDLVIDRLRHG
jgi:perosamine synthetase